MQEQQVSVITRCTILLSVLVLTAALATNIVSLAMPNWLSLQVDRSKSGANLTTSLDYFTRNTGVFLTCLTDSGAAVLSLEPFKSQVKFGTCFDSDLGNLIASNPGYLGPDAWRLTVMRRVHLGLHLASGLALACALLVCVICSARLSLGSLFASSGLSLLAAGLQFGALVAYHSGLLRELLPAAVGTATVANAFNAWTVQLQQATVAEPGSSYYVALASFCTSLSSAGITMATAARAIAFLGGGRPASASRGELEPSGSSVKGGFSNRMETASNISAGPAGGSVQGGWKLPRIPVYQAY